MTPADERRLEVKRAPLLIALVGVAVAAALLATCEGDRDAANDAPVAPPAPPTDVKPAPRKRTQTPPPESPQATANAPTTPADQRTPGETTTTVFPEDAKIAQPEHTLHGRVIDASGKPVADATVTLASCWLPQALVEDRAQILVGQFVRVEYPHVESVVRTDATGTFDLAYREGGERRLWVERGGKARTAVSDPTDAQFLEVTVADDAPSLAVRVVRAADSMPVAGAHVSLRQRSLRPLEWLGFWTRDESMHGEATTDADGRCTFEDCIAGSAKLEVLAAGLAPALGGRVEVPESGSGTHEVRLVDGYTLTGRVTDAATGAPVAGAAIHADPSRVINQTVTTTDGDGRFRIEHVGSTHPTRVSVETHASGFATERTTAGFFDFDDATQTCSLRIALHRASGLFVRCVDPHGDPIEGAIVAASSGYVVTEKAGDAEILRGVDRDDVSEDTGADGRAAIDRLHPGGDGIELRVAFYVEGVPVLERTFPPLRPGEKRDLGDVVLAPTLTLRGTVLDADGKPAAGAVVVAAVNDPEDADHGAIGTAVIERGGRRAECGADGTFTLTGLSPGLSDVHATTTIGAPGRLQLGVDPRVGSVTLRLPRIVALEGRVVDSKGTPVPNVRVGAIREEFGLRWMDASKTEADGRFWIPNFAADAPEIVLSVDPGEAQPAQTFKARPGVPTTELRLR